MGWGVVAEFTLQALLGPQSALQCGCHSACLCHCARSQNTSCSSMFQLYMYKCRVQFGRMFLNLHDSRNISPRIRIFPSKSFITSLQARILYSFLTSFHLERTGLSTCLRVHQTDGIIFYHTFSKRLCRIQNAMCSAGIAFTKMRSLTSRKIQFNGGDKPRNN